MSLRPLVRYRRLRIVSKPADSGFVQAGSWTVGLVVHTPQLSAHGLEKVNHHLLRVFPHQKLVRSPLKMKAKLRDTEYVFLLWINVDIVGRAGERRRLDEGAERSRVVALDIALESRAKAFDLTVISGVLSTTAADVHRV